MLQSYHICELSQLSNLSRWPNDLSCPRLMESKLKHTYQAHSGIAPLGNILEEPASIRWISRQSKPEPVRDICDQAPRWVGIWLRHLEPWPSRQLHHKVKVLNLMTRDETRGFFVKADANRSRVLLFCAPIITVINQVTVTSSPPSRASHPVEPPH